MTLEPDAKARHQLRTPIRMILGFCEALLAPAQTLSADQRADIEAIYRNAQQLNTLIETVTPAPTSAATSSDQAQFVVLDDQGAVYEFCREYLGIAHLIRVSAVEEIGRLGQDVQPSAIIIGTGDDRVIPLLTQLVGKDVPLLTVSFQTPQTQLNYLMKPVQFDDLDAMLQRLGVTPRDVLIVDDSRDNVDLLSRMLLSLPEPPRILKAFSGREALALLEDQTPNLILMDWLLPDMDGLAIRDYLSLDPRRADIPFVFISAHSSADILVLSHASKLTLFQMSAVSPFKLARQIHGLLANS